MIFKKSRSKKRAIEIEILVWWIIALIVLVLIFVGYFILKNKGIDALEYIKNLFRFRQS